MIQQQQPISRTIHLHKNIDQDSAAALIEQIIKINEDDDAKEKTLAAYTREPIKLIIDSFGGIIYCGFAICATIDSSKTPVHTYVYGYAMSMGLLIESFGHKRFASRLSTHCYHGGSGRSEGKFEDIRQTLEEYDRMMDVYDAELLKHTKLTREKLDEVKKYKLDWFMTAEQALEYGIIDEII